MRVNGKELFLKQETSLASFLEEQGYDSSRVAVERCGQIVPRSAFGQTLLQQEDTLEIVRFVGGG